MPRTTEQPETGGDHTQDSKPHIRSSPQTTIDLFTSSSFSTHVQALMKQWHAPGLAAAIVHDQTTASRAWGNATLDPPRQCTPDTLFDIASSSKSMTAASVGLLVDDDEKYADVQWTSSMNSLLPEDFVMAKEEYTRNVTVEDILSHRSGLPSHDFSYLGVKAEHPDNARSVTRNLRNLGIAAPIRTKWMYCNLMFTVATHLVEKLSGMTFEAFLHEKFFKPLRMDSSHLLPDAVKRAGLGDRIALPFEWREKDQEYHLLPLEQAPEAQGAGSIYTSVNDYIKYVKAMMNREGPITEELYSGVTKLRAFEDPETDQDLDPFTSAQAYAAGWEVYWYRGYKIVRHDGSISGFASMHFFLPDVKFGAVLLSNSDGGGNVIRILMRELIDEMLGIPTAERIDWKERERTSEDEFCRKNDAKLEELRRELCPDGPPQAQKTPLEAYTGRYWNVGYHSMRVVAREDRLCIDADDRSYNGLTLTFEHVCGQTQYLVRLRSGGSASTDVFKGEFCFEDGRVIKMGLQLEEDLDGLIWFDRVEDTAAELVRG